MEYDFVYDRQTRQYSMRLSAEHAVLGRFLLDEFGQASAAYQPLLQHLNAVAAHQTFQYQGKEFVLEVERGEVILNHNTLLYADSAVAAQLQQIQTDDDLTLDEQGLTSQCGLEDLVMLLTAWQQFLAE